MNKKVTQQPNSEPTSTQPAPTSAPGRIRRVLMLGAIALGFCVWTAGVFLMVGRLMGAVVSLEPLYSLLATMNQQLYVAIISALVYIISIVVATLVPWMVARQAATKRAMRPTKAMYGFSYWLPRWRDVGLAPLAYIASTLTVFGVAFVTSFVLPGVDMSQPQSLPFQPNTIYTRTDMALIYLVLAVMAPICEEILFRGYLYDRLRRFLPATATVVITAVVFGALHIIGSDSYGNFRAQINVGIIITVLGVALGILREYTGSVWASIFTHMVQNSVVFFLIFFMGQYIGR